jgi:hypothetical protein
VPISLKERRNNNMKTNNVTLFTFLFNIMVGTVVTSSGLACLTGEVLNLPFMGKTLLVCGAVQIIIIGMVIIERVR